MRFPMITALFAIACCAQVGVSIAQPVDEPPPAATPAPTPPPVAQSATPSLVPPFSAQKALAHGQRGKKIDEVDKSSGFLGISACDTVSLYSPPLRLANLGKRMKRQLLTASKEQIDQAARPYLSVQYDRRKPTLQKSGWICLGARRPSRIVLVGESSGGQIQVESVGELSVYPREWSNAMGASWTTYDAVADFDLEKAFRLVEACGSVHATVVFGAGDPVSFEFKSKDFQKLFPRWSR